MGLRADVLLIVVPGVVTMGFGQRLIAKQKSTSRKTFIVRVIDGDVAQRSGEFVGDRFANDALRRRKKLRHFESKRSEQSTEVDANERPFRPLDVLRLAARLFGNQVGIMTERERCRHNASNDATSKLTLKGEEKADSLLIDSFIAGCFVRFPHFGLEQDGVVNGLVWTMLKGFPVRRDEVAVDRNQSRLGCFRESSRNRGQRCDGATPRTASAVQPKRNDLILLSSTRDVSLGVHVTPTQEVTVPEVAVVADFDTKFQTVYIDPCRQRIMEPAHAMQRNGCVGLFVETRQCAAKVEQINVIG